MTYQTNPQRSGFRELNAEELTAVSGGYLHEDHLPDVFQDPFPSIASMLGITSWGADGDGGRQGPIIGSDAGGNFMILFVGSGSGGSSGGHQGSEASWRLPTQCEFLQGMETFGSNTLNAGAMLGALALAEPTPVGEAAAVGVIMVGGSANFTAQFFQWAIGCNR